MKVRHFVWAMALPLAMLTACDNAEKQAERATDLITLAEAQIGQDELTARQALEEKKYTEDPLVYNMYTRKGSQLAYIQLNAVDGKIVTVEAGQDHKTRTEAEATVKLWSNYTNASVFPEITYYRAQTISMENDTVNYMDGTATSDLQKLITTLHTYSLVSDETYDNFNAMANNKRAQYLLDIEAKAEELEHNEEHFFYSSDFKLDYNLATISKILNEGFDFRTVCIEVSEKQIKGKTYYRTVYTHDDDAELSFSEIIGE